MNRFFDFCMIKAPLSSLSWSPICYYLLTAEYDSSQVPLQLINKLSTYLTWQALACASQRDDFPFFGSKLSLHLYCNDSK